MGSLFDVIADIILFYPRNDMKLKHHIAKLSELEWFRNLHEDPKYTSLIWSNRKIKRYILTSINMEALIKSEKKQIEFVQLVHNEYKKEDKNFFIFHI
ncbi:hypothetical protein [Bacillus cereus]|uniref:hypothetical protein n=1 Tax=Bacillus cereus TaxID=1396 RepID=UPI000BECFC36|nr:hypothetical protein [Bacillus cereus]PEE33403.1 hypothetical protein CON59_25805 [Bacillus cereus]PET47822.1 hypothetical protein CN523_11125 [Bacillus cereus]PEV88268.1 hypothetical protein CN429_01475 [Bacillus cereus]PFA54927.1 hypothetical protein CN389_17770 [Bacillus cereus]PFD79166.1 hypothetical protein CN271_05085 [Bacillus cereus]